MRLRDLADQALVCSNRATGRTFEEFAASGMAGSRRRPLLGTEFERDFMEWEALTMERRELLGLIRETGAQPMPLPDDCDAFEVAFRAAVAAALPSPTVEVVTRTIVAIKLRVDVDGRPVH